MRRFRQSRVFARISALMWEWEVARECHAHGMARARRCAGCVEWESELHLGTADAFGLNLVGGLLGLLGILK